MLFRRQCAKYFIINVFILATAESRSRYKLSIPSATVILTLAFQNFVFICGSPISQLRAFKFTQMTTDTVQILLTT